MDNVVREGQAKGDALGTRVEELKMEAMRMKESIGAEVEERKLDAKKREECPGKGARKIEGSGERERGVEEGVERLQDPDADEHARC